MELFDLLLKKVDCIISFSWKYCMLFILIPTCVSCFDSQDNEVLRELDDIYNKNSFDGCKIENVCGIVEHVTTFGTDQQLAEAYHVLAQCYYNADSISEAFSANETAIGYLQGEYSVSDTSLYANTLILKSWIYAQYGLKDSALTVVSKELKGIGYDNIDIYRQIDSISSVANSSKRMQELVAHVKKMNPLCVHHTVVINITLFVLGFVTCICLYLLLSYVIRRRRIIKQMRQSYIARIDELEKLKSELTAIVRHKELAFDVMLNEKKELVAQLESLISDMEKNKEIDEHIERENKLMNANIVVRFKQLGSTPKLSPLADDWVELRNHVICVFPEFFKVINKYAILRDDEEKICMLVRLHFKPSAIACIMGVSKQSVSIIRSRMCAKVFRNEECSAAAFDKGILEMFC